MSETKNICVIGAGAGGLSALTLCLQAGFKVTCYEKTDYTGGLWRYHEEDVDGVASVMKTTVINSSKELSALSFNPPPKHAPNYMHHSQWVQYLCQLDNSTTRQFIKFNTTVESVVRASDHKDTGRWVVKVVTKEGGKQVTSENTFDAVAVCTGHHVKPLVPTFKGQEKFKGKILHSHSYRSANEFEDKNVVVVGVGNSGGDVAAEVGNISKNCYMSTRRGTWVLKRVGKNGIPGDVAELTHFWNFLFNHLPYNVTNWIRERDLNRDFDHELYGLKPAHRSLSQHPMVNDSLPNRIITGRVIIKSNVREFVEDGVIFEGDEHVTKVDAAILCTGYSFWFPFLDRDVLEYDENHNIVDLYKFMYNPALEHPETLPIIALFQTIGAGFPAGELQIRWFIELMKGTKKLPPKEEMLQEINERREYNRKRFVDSDRHRHNVDYINFMDDLAKEVGCKPNLWYYFFTDPVLWYTMFFGPSLPYQYRLQGPDALPSQARQLILTYKERIQAPLKTRTIDDSNNNQLGDSQGFMSTALKLLSSFFNSPSDKEE